MNPNIYLIIAVANVTLLIYIQQKILFRLRHKKQWEKDFQESIKEGAVKEPRLERWLTKYERDSIEEEILVSSSIVSFLKSHPTLSFILFKMGPVMCLLGGGYFGIWAGYEKGIGVGIGVFLFVFILYLSIITVELIATIWLQYILLIIRYSKLYLDFRSPVSRIEGQVTATHFNKFMGTEFTSHVKFAVRNVVFKTYLLNLYSILLHKPPFYLNQQLRKSSIHAMQTYLKTVIMYCSNIHLIPK